MISAAERLSPAGPFIGVRIAPHTRKGQRSPNAEYNGGDGVHFCFHDSAHNWDNNNGLNWTIQVHNG
nr:carbohydrate-binding protein [Heliomicrobium modesticaldum]